MDYNGYLYRQGWLKEGGGGCLRFPETGHVYINDTLIEQSVTLIIEVVNKDFYVL